jgi:citrate synthase
MLWEASVLDPNEVNTFPCRLRTSLTAPQQGIRFHGHTIPDCQKILAPAPGGKEIIPESMLWLLLTGQIPSEAQVRALSAEFAENGTLDEKTIKLIDGCVSSHAPARVCLYS